MKPLSISKTIAAYMAGIIDGEGSITLQRKKRKSSFSLFPKLTVGNTSETLINWFESNICPPAVSLRRNKPPRKPLYNCTWCASNAESILLACLPFMVIKCEQARLALLILSKNRLNGNKPLNSQTLAWMEEAASKIKELNKRGSKPLAFR